MENNLNTFSNAAKDLSRNPLGIIALFIVLVYGLACTLFINSSSTLATIERLPLIYFVIIFPIIVLILFGWLVAKHHNKLYAPTDYREDSSFLEATRNISQTQEQKKIDTILTTTKEKKVDKNKIENWMEFGKEFKTSEDREKLIIDDIISAGLDNIDDSTVKALTRNLSVYQLFYEFEEIYNIIFASQIKILNIANDKNDKKINISYAESLFNDVKEKNIHAFENWSFNDYIKYLIEINIISHESDSLRITEKGQDFTSYIKAKNYNIEIKNL